MATIKKKTVNGKAYFYLQHTIRDGNVVSTREKYLGIELPAGMDEIQSRFLAEI